MLYPVRRRPSAGHSMYNQKRLLSGWNYFPNRNWAPAYSSKARQNASSVIKLAIGFLGPTSWTIVRLCHAKCQSNTAIRQSATYWISVNAICHGGKPCSSRGGGGSCGWTSWTIMKSADGRPPSTEVRWVKFNTEWTFLLISNSIQR